MKIEELLNSCTDDVLKEWAANKSWQEIYNTCHRGSWLLLLFRVANPKDLQLLTLAKGFCANTVRHLMKDARSILALDAAIEFGEGKITKEQLTATVSAAIFAATDAASAAKDTATISATAVNNYIKTASKDATVMTEATAVYVNAAYIHITIAEATAIAAIAAVVTAEVTGNTAFGCDTVAYVADAYAKMEAVKGTVAAAKVSPFAAVKAADTKSHQLVTANIIRQYIPIDKWNVF